jgi:hypothetical protein
MSDTLHISPHLQLRNAVFLAAAVCVCTQTTKESLHNGVLIRSHIPYATGNDAEDVEHEMYAHGNTSKSAFGVGIVDKPADMQIHLVRQ